MLQEKNHFSQERFVARFAAAKERAGMKEMKSKRGLHMNLEHLDPEFLFLRTLYELLVYNLLYVFWGEECNDVDDANLKKRHFINSIVTMETCTPRL